MSFFFVLAQTMNKKIYFYKECQKWKGKKDTTDIRRTMILLNRLNFQLLNIIYVEK